MPQSASAATLHYACLKGARGQTAMLSPPKFGEKGGLGASALHSARCGLPTWGFAENRPRLLISKRRQQLALTARSLHCADSVRFRCYFHRPDELARMPAYVKGFGCRPMASVRQAPGSASESLQGMNPRVMRHAGAAGAMGISA